jgi:hypothetical protein
LNKPQDLETALGAVQQLLRARPDSRALQSIVEQLEHLRAFARGENDGAMLARINIGVLAMREIEDADLDLAEALYRIEGDAHRAAQVEE